MKENTFTRPFKTWNHTEQETWRRLATRQLINAEGKLSRHFFSGIKELHIEADQIPDFDHLKKVLQQKTGWSLMSTELGYADGQTWFETLQKKHFMVTEYIRPLDSLDYTPMPDMFHDTFGHLPFLVNKDISRIITKFTATILKCSPAQRKKLGHIWWYTIEFGLIKENGEVKAWGAGLASSFGELNRVFAGETLLEKFSPEVVGATPNSPHKFHDKLFVLDSFAQLETIVDNWPLQ
ncbi:MAG TPA: hypothetical protein VF209_02925 [Patescibacteria group bacterium]